MHALQWFGRRDVRLVVVADPPPPGLGQVLLDVACCGLCGTDLAEYEHGPIWIPTSQPHPVTGGRAPLTLGHEISGWVRSVGPEVTGFEIGDLVVANALLPCAHCASCASGAPQRCANLGHLGLNADGGLGEQLLVPADMLVVVPKGIDADVACLAEPFAVAWHATDLAGELRGRSCLVIGAGCIGLAVALVLLDRGATAVVVDVAPERLTVAERLGIPARLVAELEATGELFDVVIECSGSGGSPGLAVRRTGPGGTVVLCGLPVDECPVDIETVALRELRLFGSAGHLVAPDLTRAVDLLARTATTVSQLITARVPLKEAVDHGLQLIGGPDRRDHTKVVVTIAPDRPASPANR